MGLLHVDGAAAGIKAGQAIGTTDEIGLRAVRQALSRARPPRDHSEFVGLDHLRLTFSRNGRGERATINGGGLITEL